MEKKQTIREMYEKVFMSTVNGLLDIERENLRRGNITQAEYDKRVEFIGYTLERQRAQLYGRKDGWGWDEKYTK